MTSENIFLGYGYTVTETDGTGQAMPVHTGATDNPTVFADTLRAVAAAYDPDDTADADAWAAREAAEKTREREALIAPWREVVSALTEALGGLAGHRGRTAVPDARCCTLPDGSCAAPGPCMHTPPGTVDPPEAAGPRTWSGFAANIPYDAESGWAEPAGPPADVLEMFLRDEGWSFTLSGVDALRRRVRNLRQDRDNWRAIAVAGRFRDAARPTVDRAGWERGFAAGVRWAAAEADAQVEAQGRAWYYEPSIVDLTDHLRLSADDPARVTTVERPTPPAETAQDGRTGPSGYPSDPQGDSGPSEAADDTEGDGPVTAETVPPEIMEYVNLRAGREHRPGGRVAATVAGVITRWERLRAGRFAEEGAVPFGDYNDVVTQRDRLRRRLAKAESGWADARMGVERLRNALADERAKVQDARQAQGAVDAITEILTEGNHAVTGDVVESVRSLVHRVRPPGPVTT